MKKILLLLILILSLTGINSTFSNKFSYKDALDSTCIIKVEALSMKLNNMGLPVPELSTQCGTGVCIGETDTDYLILTAAHILDGTIGTPHLVFPTSKIDTTGKVLYSNLKYDAENYKFGIPGDDIGLIAIPKSVGPLRTQPIDLDRPDVVFTVGCSTAEYPSIVLSNVIQFMPDSFRLSFSPRHGRSGSGVFSSKGLVGMVLLVDGGCTDARKIKKVLDCYAKPVDKSCFLPIIGRNWPTGSITPFLLIQAGLVGKEFVIEI